MNNETGSWNQLPVYFFSSPFSRYFYPLKTSTRKPIMDFISNPQIELAFDYVRFTDKNIFLTGKAGTGKTTFLHSIKSKAIKRMVVVAPTGVAAINAGGMTIHSFFQLPFGPWLPSQPKDSSRQRRFNRKKVNLIKSLDLLVIDEISMVRADILDSIDEVLRRYRATSRPFGGVQLLMIGDLHQLPPVVKQEEWELLREHYQTPYFFGSVALQKTDPVTIQLKHIYRQSDSIFIDLLNKVRDNKMDTEVLDTLNSRYQKDFQPKEGDGYITLTSHNAAAQNINAQKLDSITETPHFFQAEITGDFPAHTFPTEERLELKIGAQVMFVKNDISPEKLFYNGKIGQVTRIDDDAVFVKCPDEPSPIAVSKLEWKNVKFELDEKTKEVNENIIGSFVQYPLKLAWAITIHKSQGLTFERAIIDAQAAFAHGQVYVALSRCKSFEGIVLRSKIAYSSVKTDTVVKYYSEEAERNAPDESHLKNSKREFQQFLLFELFDFKKITQRFDKLHRVFLEHETSLQGNAFDQLKDLAGRANEHVFTPAKKFIPHLHNYFMQAEMPEENEQLQGRIKKAATYFSEKLDKELIPSVKNIKILTDNKAVGKTASERLEDLQLEMFIKNACFVACQKGFSTQAYIQAKANAELDFQAAKKKPASSSSWIGHSTSHPELYALLSRWRREMADAIGVEQYMVLPTKSLLELVQKLPTNSASLKNIKGFGQQKIKRFGADIISIIEKYCSAKNIPTDQFSFAVPRAVKTPKKDTKTVSLELFKSGRTMEEIASERGLAKSTIEGHLAHFIGLGELDILNFIDRKKVDEIEQFFIENKTKASSVAKEHFGDKYSYGELKMVLRNMERENVN